MFRACRPGGSSGRSGCPARTCSTRTPARPGRSAAIPQDPGGHDDAETPITGDGLDKPKAAALAHTGGGRVTDTEVGDEEGYYEVEVTTSNGRRVDVHLDKDFKVLGTDSDGSGDKPDTN